MAKLADAPDLGSGGTPRAGSSPVIRIGFKNPDFIGILIFPFK